MIAAASLDFPHALRITLTYVWVMDKVGVPEGPRGKFCKVPDRCRLQRVYAWPQDRYPQHTASPPALPPAERAFNIVRFGSTHEALFRGESVALTVENLAAANGFARGLATILGGTACFQAIQIAIVRVVNTHAALYFSPRTLVKASSNKPVHEGALIREAAVGLPGVTHVP